MVEALKIIGWRANRPGGVRPDRPGSSTSDADARAAKKPEPAAAEPVTAGRP